jgi:hypothetical protein
VRRRKERGREQQQQKQQQKSSSFSSFFRLGGLWLLDFVVQNFYLNVKKVEADGPPLITQHKFFSFSLALLHCHDEL